jgi:hypothetical protein
VEKPQPVLEHLRLAFKHQSYRPARLADIQRLIALIENQHWTVD